MGVMVIGSMIAWYRAAGRECSLLLMNYTQTSNGKDNSPHPLQYLTHDDSDGGGIGSIAENVDEKPVNQSPSREEDDNGDYKNGKVSHEGSI